MKCPLCGIKLEKFDQTFRPYYHLRCYNCSSTNIEYILFFNRADDSLCAYHIRTYGKYMLRSINTDGKIWTELDNSFETMNAKYVSMKTDCFIPLDIDKDIKL